MRIECDVSSICESALEYSFKTKRRNQRARSAIKIARLQFSLFGNKNFDKNINIGLYLFAGSTADNADTLEVGDEILEVNGRTLENATHNEVIQYISQVISNLDIIIFGNVFYLQVCRVCPIISSFFCLKI